MPSLIARVISSSSTFAHPLGVPLTKFRPPIVQQPRETSETLTSVLPRFRYFTRSSLSTKDQWATETQRHREKQQFILATDVAQMRTDNAGTKTFLHLCPSVANRFFLCVSVPLWPIPLL